MSEKFDASHRDVQMGEVKEGLHRVEGHVRPGIALLEGSQVKALEEASYRNWQQQRHTQQQQQHRNWVVPELEFDPFSEQELLVMNKPVPKSKTIQKMSKIGGGAFGTTYRKRVRDGAVNSDASRFAVKVISADRMEDMHIEADDVRREALILSMLRHRHVILYFGLMETDEEFTLVMELAEGGSLADLITITKTSGSGQGVQMGEVLEMTGQLASALDYIHGQGIVHRDIKADNILLAHTNGAGPLCVKLADFGMAAVLATVGGSNLLSKVGTPPYFSPERGKDKAYGTKADMWALGCVLIELVTQTRLQRGLWNDDTEVVERRNNLLGEVKLRDESVGNLVQGLLETDKSCRLSALGLKAACSALVPAHTTPHGRSSSGQAAAESRAAAEAKAKAEAQAKAAAEKCVVEKAAAAKAAADAKAAAESKAAAEAKAKAEAQSKAAAEKCAAEKAVAAKAAADAKEATEAKVAAAEAKVAAVGSPPIFECQATMSGHSDM